MAFATLIDIAVTAAVLQLIYILYRSLYRLFLHPLAPIPGPKLAALTSWYECYYDVFMPGQYVFKIKDLHKQYGPILRITPREIHINDVEFLDEIYAPGPARKRDKDGPKSAGLKVNQSVGGAISSDLHRKRRESLNPFFAQRKVVSLERMIQQKVEKLCQMLGLDENGSEDHAIVNISDAYFALALDVVSRYCFGADDDILGDAAQASALRNNLSRLLRGVKFNYHFGWVRTVIARLPTSVGKHFVPAGVIDMMNFRKKIRQSIQCMHSGSTKELESSGESIFHELWQNPLLPSEDKSLQRFEDEGTLLVMAGTESTAKSMCIAQYHLLVNPQVLQRLRAELRTLPIPASLTALEQSPYLNAIIAEANRLSFGITGRNCRVAPDETLRYKSHTIPAGTPMSMSSLCVHTNEDIFPNPWTFDPERWLGPEANERRKYQFAFGRGPRKCIGINLAHAESCLAIAAVARYDMHLCETDDEDVRFQHDYHIAHPRLDSKGVLAVVGKG